MLTSEREEIINRQFDDVFGLPEDVQKVVQQVRRHNTYAASWILWNYNVAPCGWMDFDKLDGVFIWSESPQGPSFWANIFAKIEEEE